jgi:hypothetical protein
MFICFPLCPCAFLAKAKVSLKSKGCFCVGWPQANQGKSSFRFYSSLNKNKNQNKCKRGPRQKLISFYY